MSYAPYAVSIGSRCSIADRGITLIDKGVLSLWEVQTMAMYFESIFCNFVPNKILSRRQKIISVDEMCLCIASISIDAIFRVCINRVGLLRSEMLLVP